MANISVYINIEQPRTIPFEQIAFCSILLVTEEFFEELEFQGKSLSLHLYSWDSATTATIGEKNQVAHSTKYLTRALNATRRCVVRRQIFLRLYKGS